MALRFRFSFRQRLFWSLVDQLVQGFPVITHNRSIGAVHPEKCHDLLHDRDQRGKHDCYWRATVRKTTIPSRIGRREVCLLRDHDQMEKHDCHWRAKVRKTNWVPDQDPALRLRDFLQAASMAACEPNEEGQTSI